MKKTVPLLLILILLLTSCSAGEYCKISDVPLRIFENVTDVVIDEGDDAYFYSKKDITDVCIYKMEWDYATESYKQITASVKGLSLTKGDALRIVFDGTQQIPYVRITFNLNGEINERYIYRDQNDRLWVLNLENSD